jgi:hypothetical protein
MRAQSLALRFIALLAALMIYYGFYSRLNRIVNPPNSAINIELNDSLLWQSDKVRW